MTVAAADRVERTGFATLATGLLSPVLAQGLWRPLEHVLGSAGSAAAITGAALAICLSNAGVQSLLRPRTPWVLLFSGGLVAVVSTATLALGAAGLGALLAVAAASAWLLRWLPPRLPTALDGLARRHPVLTAIYLCFALMSVVSTARVCVFMGDPTAVEDQALPGEKFTETHSCLSAYERASELARRRVDNLYADHWWYGSLGLPPLPEGEPNPYHPFTLDNFSYPPPFLLVASVLTPLDGDFLAQRALWFGLNAIVAAIGLYLVARWIDGPTAHRVLLLTPLLLGSMPFLLTLQIGNFHLVTVALSVLAMAALERGRVASGGALLALTTLSKISPGVLGVGLLARRRAREVAFTAGFGALLLALSTLCFGLDPLRSFLGYALPRLSTGAAFPFIETDAGILTNMSPFGIPLKLSFLGFHVGDPLRLGRLVARVFTLAVLILSVVAARRQGDRRDQAIRWMSLLFLAAMQSPFCPAYATLGLLWATALLSIEVRRLWSGLALVALWPAILLVPPGLAPASQVVLSLAHTSLCVGLSTWLILRAPRGGSGPAPASPSFGG